MSQIGMILLAILLILMAILWFGVTAIPVIVLGILALVTAIFILIDPVMSLRTDPTKPVNIGLILLAVLLVAMALVWFGVAVPLVALGILAIITAVFLLIGR